MNRVPILAGGAVLAAVVLCGGAVTMANAMAASAPSSEVLSISGVTTIDPTATATATATATPTSTATSDAGDDGGVTVVTPADPTEIDGKGRTHLDKNGAVDPDTKGDIESSHHSQGTPVAQDSDDTSGVAGSDTSGRVAGFDTSGRADSGGTVEGGGDSGGDHGGDHGGSDGGTHGDSRH